MKFEAAKNKQNEAKESGADFSGLQKHGLLRVSLQIQSCQLRGTMASKRSETISDEGYLLTANQGRATSREGVEISLSDAPTE